MARLRQRARAGQGIIPTPSRDIVPTGSCVHATRGPKGKTRDARTAPPVARLAQRVHNSLPGAAPALRVAGSIDAFYRVGGF
jgi:hypothetical protein